LAFPTLVVAAIPKRAKKRKKKEHGAEGWTRTVFEVKKEERKQRKRPLDTKLCSAPDRGPRHKRPFPGMVDWSSKTARTRGKTHISQLQPRNLLRTDGVTTLTSPIGAEVKGNKKKGTKGNE